VEFAFVAIFLLVVVFGIIDFARLFFAYATMSNGAREGARFGITHADPSFDAEIEDRARQMMVLIGAEANVQILRPGEDDGSNPGCTTPHACRIQVIVTSNFDIWTPILPNMNLTAQSTMHFE
jgi:hypothetical protein